MMKDGSLVRITDSEWIAELEIDKCVGWEGEEATCIEYCRDLASGIGEITDDDFDDFDDVWVTFGAELMLAVPKAILECVNEEGVCCE